MMSLGDGLSKIQSGLRDLLASWEETRETWKDPVADGFEKEHIETIRQTSQASIRGLELLDAILRKAQQDCQ